MGLTSPGDVFPKRLGDRLFLRAPPSDGHRLVYQSGIKVKVCRHEHIVSHTIMCGLMCYVGRSLASFFRDSAFYT